MLDINTNLSEIERHQILWLDTTEKNSDTCKRQRCNLNLIVTYTSIEECEEYIRHNEHYRITLIVNDPVKAETITKLSELESVTAIYFRTSENATDKSEASQLKNIWHVTTSIDIDNLIERIKSDEKKRTRASESLVFNIFQTDSSSPHEMTSTEIKGEFLHSQLLLDSLLTMKVSNNELSLAIAHCRTEYENSPSDLSKIDEFQSNYSSEQALSWYTQDSFVYRILNRAFRSQNIDVLYLMRFIIRDIYKQLTEQQNEATMSSDKVYRAQLISKEELENFVIGNLVSMNSFFSTTLTRAYALFLLASGQIRHQDLAYVLFEINISRRLAGAKPFADITTKSAFPVESEILFMAGSIFRIVDIQLENNDVCVVKLVLCGDDDHNLKTLFEHMREDIPPECTSIAYGIVLANASKLEQAERFFRNVLNELPIDDPLITHCYHQLGNVLDDKGEFEESLDYFEKALAKKLETLNEDDPRLANTYTCCGVGYLRKNDLKRAIFSYQKALDIYKNAYGHDHEDVAMCLFNIGDVNIFENKFEDALEMFQQALNIWMKCLPENHPDLARSHMAIGNAYVQLLHCDQALMHYDTALKIMLNSLPSDHHELAALHDKLGNLYYSTGDNEHAQEHFEQALLIKRKHYSSDHSSMVDTYHAIGLIYKDSGDYQRAVELLEQAVAIHRNILPPEHESSIQLLQDLTGAKAALTSMMSELA
ncbi:unnamed protein product [Rotaria socialis]|uniref:Uncharacterized protein n=1 Tax=Rotaria socialis TaxID=392032 RepID=A0A818KH85_9BILA|nr:unnamed protein product [Rotaria socialis]CAF3555168.1 unnamed protein product [Rotaria socialis]CAF4272349.1 unnamed protein product [Rotaria socialis]CAF4472241.1 unnamed protein product [Rotaria socialis]